MNTKLEYIYFIKGRQDVIRNIQKCINTILKDLDNMTNDDVLNAIINCVDDEIDINNKLLNKY